MQYKALWFDLDYTLYDMGMYIDLVFKDITGALGELTDVPSEEIWGTLHGAFRRYGSTYNRLFDMVLDTLNLTSKENIRLCMDIYHAPPSLRRHSLTLYEDVVPLLMRMGRTCTLGILTNGNPAMQRRKIVSLGLANHVDYTIYASEFVPKPSSESYMCATELSDCSPCGIVYVGDNPYTDFRGAKNVGWRTIRILRGEFRNVHSGTFIDQTVMSLEELNGNLGFGGSHD